MGRTAYVRRAAYFFPVHAAGTGGGGEWVVQLAYLHTMYIVGQKVGTQARQATLPRQTRASERASCPGTCPGPTGEAGQDRTGQEHDDTVTSRVVSRYSQRGEIVGQG